MYKNLKNKNALYLSVIQIIAALKPFVHKIPSHSTFKLTPLCTIVMW